jgi:hypothetical protein
MADSSLWREARSSRTGRSPTAECNRYCRGEDFVNAQAFVFEALMPPRGKALLLLAAGDPHQANVIAQDMLQGSVDTTLEEGSRAAASRLQVASGADQLVFFSRTDLQPDHVCFWLQREDKENICRELRITHFIDDRVHIMQILRRVVPRLCLFGEPEGERGCPPWATFASSWPEVVDWVRNSQ